LIINNHFALFQLPGSCSKPKVGKNPVLKCKYFLWHIFEPVWYGKNLGQNLNGRLLPYFCHKRYYYQEIMFALKNGHSLDRIQDRGPVWVLIGPTKQNKNRGLIRIQQLKFVEPENLFLEPVKDRPAPTRGPSGQSGSQIN
jgi:hypothetical protein